ncbi:MAG: SxtJ family membrane protein [Bacteroidota bacterium]|nr:SxtJ family membrane protein [Bacteroidota bacterium]
MILQELKNIKETKKDLRKFGITIGSVILIIAMLLLYFGKTHYYVYGIIALLFILTGLFIPAVLKPLNKVWMGFSIILGFFTSRIILTILFYLIITPMALIFRIIGKDPLNINTDKKVSSYWIKRENTSVAKIDFERQF